MAVESEDTNKDNLAGLSAKEQEILVKSFVCFKDGQPMVDWWKLANLSGYTNHRSAYNAHRAALKKAQELWAEKDEDGNPIVSPKTPKKAATPKRGKKADAVNTPVNGNGDDNEPFGTGGTVSNPSPAKRSAGNDDDDDELAGSTPPKKKRAPAKKKKEQQEANVDEDGKKTATPKRGSGGRAKKAAASVNAGENGEEATDPTTPKPNASTPKKRASGGGRKKKADSTDVKKEESSANAADDAPVSPVSPESQPTTPAGKSGADVPEPTPPSSKGDDSVMPEVKADEDGHANADTNANDITEEESEHVNVIDQMVNDGSFGS